MSIIVRQATIHDLDVVAPLFDAYRQFYAQPADLALSRRFLAERFQHAESVILLALNEADGEGVGFTQLYPLFSSVRATRRYLLNDLFVTPARRRFGVAAALLHAATAHARAMGVSGMSLSTANDNVAAQRLYESMGWELEQGFREYHLTL
ncbi:GNAT superfamily N-acetyltransferase [Dyella sp. SG562]|uniref:GNAT family N-acetyltransferase n=1 Tax=unclassified Dyella TaxID=2634549 RepID=UPI00141EFA50|nr:MULTISPECIES: GNAT family N-acetyltransferase [unclassified Dyella]MBT2119071.1 GNAT family N-acetyltransferase [Dyella sp. LX-1]MBT2140407.1 GNAT family N-acetyltransferase [Dyella sp. LX-66]NII75572.1 GNAT superfamily N-acetyltransferase [Dyella sp. SG562]